MAELLQNYDKDLDIYMRCFYKGCRHVICIYNVAPLTGEINLRNFQEIAAKRLALLQYIDSRSDARTKSQKSREPEKERSCKLEDIEEKMEEFGLILPNPVFDKESMLQEIHVAQADIISHFILRLAFASDKERREWFIRNETRLFEIRMERLRGVKIQELEGQNKLESFLLNQGIRYDTLAHPQLVGQAFSSGTKNEDVQRYYDLIRFRSDANKIEKLYITPFYPDAVNLIRSRQVVVLGGMSYVPSTCLHIVASSKFRSELIDSLRFLEENQRFLEGGVLKDERLSSFLKVLPKSYLAADYSNFGGLAEGDGKQLSLSNINKIYKRTFPPCMRRIFEYYLKNGHLKHWGRQQLWLFLKGCGMTLEESIQLNRKIWTDSSKFEKEHVYNIRHMYGREGKRANYPPYTCSRILSQFPPSGGGSVHGCPFKELDVTNLRGLMHEFGLEDSQISPIIELKSSHQYNLACSEYFGQVVSKNLNANGIGIHPNLFFQESLKQLLSRDDSSI